MSVGPASLPERTAALKPTAVNSILAEVRSLQAQGREVVSLMRGEPDLPTPPHIVEAAVRALHSKRTSYPNNRGEPELREAIAEKLVHINAVAYDPETEILVTDGATLAIHAALMALAGPGDHVLLPDPVYDAYQSPIRLAGAEPRPVRSICREGRFALSVDGLEAACTPNTRVLLLNTPWNPVGTVLKSAELAAVGEFVCRRNLTLISDEIYEAITYDGHSHASPAALSPEIRRRCVLVNSFSKTYSMTGWRLGYAAGPADVIRSMFLVLQQSSRGPATFVQDAGVEALNGPQDCVDEMVAEYARRRQAVSRGLAGLARAFAFMPEGGFFTMMDVSATGRTSDDVRRRLLLDHGVSVVHGRAYGEAGEGTLRVSFAAGGDVLHRGLALLQEGLEAL
jgi:aspartate/methionine/tyrosine aminotransferase